MPISPQHRPQQEQQHQSDGRSTAGSGRAKRKSKPTTKAKNRRKKAKVTYAKAREDAQLAGAIPTTPDGAVRNERIRPCADPALPELVRQALREKWNTPDAAKPDILASLLIPFYEDMTVVDPLTGILVKMRPSPKMLNELAKTIAMLDQDQYDRDNPKQVKPNSGDVTIGTVNVQNNLKIGDVFDDIERDTRLILGTQDGDIQADGDAEPLDAPEPDTSKTQPEAD